MTVPDPLEPDARRAPGGDAFAARDRGLAALRADTCGAILVVGIALGGVLVAAIAELVAVGDTIIEREAAQAAVDASALENAIWHARGMNVVAALNIVIGLLVAVLLLWRLVLAASTLASLAALVAAPLGAGGARPPQPPLAALLGANADVEARVRAMLRGLEAAQASVAAYTPLLARRAATAFEGRAERQLETFSASAWAAEAGTTPLAPDARLVSPVSLPLQAAPFSLLCAQPSSGWERRAAQAAARVLGSSAAATASRPIPPRALALLGVHERGSATTLAARWSGLADEMSPGVFCAPATAAFDGLAAFGRELAPAASSRDALRALEVLERGSAAAASPEARPALVWSRTRNGDVYLRSAARLSAGTRDGLAGVELPGVAAHPPAPLIAHAEMYFDCAADWARCAPDAAWQPRWRARLRRVRPLVDLLAAAADDARAWRAGRELPPEAHEPLRGTLPVELASARSPAQPLAQRLSDAAAALRFIH